VVVADRKIKLVGKDEEHDRGCNQGGRNQPKSCQELLFAPIRETGTPPAVLGQA
jgi:hypothetical protein